MRTSALRAAVSCCFLAALAACPPPPQECLDGTEDVCDAGALPPDFCNSQEEALSDATNCHLTVTTAPAMMPLKKDGVFLSRLPDAGVDQDWYYAEVPSGLTARSLLHVSGGYSAPQTAVNFSVNVLKQASDGGFVSVLTAVDKHGAAAPRPVDVIVPFTEPNARLYALVADEGSSGQVRVDNRNTYSLYMEVLENPDLNEPNDTAPTVIALSGTPAGGQGTGYLATNDDVDLFSFTVPGGGRQIIYLNVLGPDPHPTNPPPPYRLSYTLYDPGDRPIAEGVMANNTLRIDLATARLAPMAGVYRLKVAGLREPAMTTPVRGDLRVRYTVDVKLLPDLDTQEGSGGNDSPATAKAVTMSPNGRTALVGKLSYVADEEWFRVTLPARGTPSTFRYRLTAAAGGGRFEPLSATPARQVRVTREVTMGATVTDRQVACRTSRAACPRADDLILSTSMLIDALCNGTNPPQCLVAQRSEEVPRLANLRNLVGAIPVTANQATEFLVLFRDEGLGASKYADDRDWTLELEWLDDADEALRLGGPTVVTLGGTTQVASGELTWGYGKVLDVDSYFRSTDAVRGLYDYDAFDTDKDLLQFNLGGAMGEPALELSWELLHPDGGTAPPGELALELTFCGAGGAADGGLCGGQQTRIFGYNGGSLTPWYLPQSASNGRMLFTRTSSAASTTVTVAPVSCACLSTDRAAAGVYFANVAAVHRTSNAPLRYRVSQRIAPYPASFVGIDGGTASCPVLDGGCGFIR
jgi:hypothetical protein